MEDDSNDTTNQFQIPPVSDLIDLADLAQTSDVLAKGGGASEISLHAITCTLIPKTMRIFGHVHGKKIVVVLDSGSTHNFVDPLVVHKAQISYKPMESFAVQIANRDQIQSEEKCMSIYIRLQGHIFRIEGYILSLSGHDMVLDIQWLKDLCPIL